MRRYIVVTISLLSLVGFQVAYGQEVQVNRANRTVSVTVTESVQVDPELAEVPLGYYNYGRTRELAYDDNVRNANTIIQALLDAGVSKSNIETTTLRLNRVSHDSDVPQAVRQERQFEAEQKWTVRVPVADAQKVVDLAVAAGANEVEDVEWIVAEPRSLEARASETSLAKARGLAHQIAKELGGKLGELLYASNRAPVPKGILGALQTQMSTLRARVETREKPIVKLFPQRVKQEATVHAIFALE